jgi:hypothetical protein
LASSNSRMPTRPGESSATLRAKSLNTARCARRRR